MNAFRRALSMRARSASVNSLASRTRFSDMATNLEVEVSIGSSTLRRGASAFLDRSSDDFYNPRTFLVLVSAL
jgi:hypothetical protein